MSTGTAGLDRLLRVRDGHPSLEPTWEVAKVLTHEPYAERYRRLRLHAPHIARQARPGQFVMVNVNDGDSVDVLLPRPMAVHAWDAGLGTIDLVYNVVGRGTALLSEVSAGDERLLTGPLGRGFAVPLDSRRVLVVGRGVGICSVVSVADDAKQRHLEVSALISTRASTAPGLDDLAELGVPVTTVSDTDGSSDTSAVALMLHARYDADPPDYIAVCGSNRLIRLAARLGRDWAATVEASVEAHMACGLGYCHGCAAPVAQEPTSEGPLVCVDGPVFAIDPS